MLIGLINPTGLQGFYELSNDEQRSGYIIARIFMYALCVWLIGSGIQKRQSKAKQRTVSSEENK